MEANHETSIAPDGSLGYKDNQNMESDDQARVSIDMIDDAEKDFKKFRETNPEVTKTNLRIIKNILNRLHTATSKINNMKPLDKEAYYYVINSGTIVIYEICRMLRLANYYKLAARYLQFNIMSLDHNIILTTGKYLHWRVKNYIECSRAFADSKDFPKAIETIQKGIVQVDRLKKIEEQDPPVLDADKQAIESGFRLLREMEIKYQLQSGTLTPEQWKKKIEDTFKDHYHRALCVVESLTTDQSDNCIPIQQKTDKTPWKKEALNQGISLLHPNIEKVKEALIQIHEHKKKEKEKQGLTFNSENPDAEVEEMLATHKQMHDEMIKEKEWKQASYGAPLEIHIQMIIFAYETGNRDQFESLLKSALIRLKFRRYEVPYVSTVDILMSTSKDANIPNSFMKLPKDLNAANLRNELAKLKKAHKKKGGEEEVKKEPIKATKDKGKEKGKEKAPEPVAEVEEEQEVIATPEELEQIKHIYVNLLIQRSKNPKNAIVGLNVAMIDETSEYEIPENHYAVAVPIRQHDGIYEKNQTIPYIMFKRTPNFLRDEEDLLSLITDVTVISGKSPNILPPLGYHKIPLDLRQTPHDLERAPDVDYVFICYKTDKDINTYERDLLTLKKLSDLSQSLVSLSDPKSQEIPYGAKNVGMLYDFELLMDITKNVKDSLLGPVGTFYARERHDQLDCLSRILLTKFIFPVRKKMEQYFELKSQGELVAADRINFKEVLLRIHAILAKNTLKKPELVLVYLIASIYLSNLCEEDGDYRNSIQIMRSALSRVVEARESRLKSNLEYSTNPVAAMSVHVHGHKIHEIQKAKQERYKTWENLILRRERERIRQDKGLPPLDEDEADEEASEIERLENEKHDFQDYILKQKKADEPADGEQDANKPNWREKDYYEYFSTLDDLLNDLHIDVLACLYRCEIKLGQEFRDVNLKTTKMLKIKGIKAPNENTAGLSTTLKKKFTMKNTKSIAKASEDFKGLQQTLQEAGKIPVSRPPATNFEKIVMLENGHNVYQNALFSMQVSISKDNSVEQKSLLMESFEYIKKGVEDEEKLKRIIIDNSASVKIAEHLMNYEVKGANVLEKQPLNLMDKTRYLKKTNVPPKPIFLSRTSTTITMRLPYFRPMTDHKEWRNIDKMALFGKESGSGVAVSLNNTEFPGTGDRVNPGSIVTVSALSPNKKYVFACGGYTVDNICVNGIGETSEEILTALPLNLNILYGYLSQIAFKLRQLQISKKAAETLLTQFIDKNETRYRMINGERNPVLLFKLKYSDINMISVTTIRQIVEAFLILASISKLQKVNFEKQPIGVDSIQVKKTKLQLRICNFLLLALELSILLKNPILIKRTVSELFNHTLPFLSFDPRPEFLKNYLIYVHQAILMIPGDHMDGSIRRIGSCLSYEIHKDQIYHLKDQENELYRKLLMTEISIDLRKWQTYSQIVTKIDQLTEEQLAKQKEQREILAKGEEIATDLLIKDPEPYEVSETYVVERELEGKAYEEFLLVFKNEYTEARAEKWKVKLNKLVPVLTNGEEVIESLTKEIDQTVQFWKGVKENPEEQIRNEALKENPRFLEFVCKAFQRVIELGQKANEELQELVKGVVLDDETMKNLEDSIQQTKSNLANDTVQRRQNRFTLIEEKVKNMQEQREDVAIEEVELPKLFVAIRKELASSDQFQKTDYKPSQLRYFLQVSQFLYVKAMVRTLINRQKYEYRQDTGLPAYQNIQLLDFSDVITQSNDFKDQLMSARQRIRDEMIEQKQNEKQDQINQPADGEGDKDRIPDEHEIELPVEDKIKAITETISLLSRACQYGQVSKSWVLLENIVKYTWNLISYELVSPLELSQTDAYKDIFLITESVLNLLSHMKLSTETEDKSTASESVVGDRTTKFQDEQGTNFVPEKRIAINEADLKFYSGFIAYTIQCLFVAEKWESMVDLADIAAKQFLMISPDPDDDLLFLLSYLLQFRIYGEDKLYSAASEETQRVKYALEERIREFQHWKATSKKSKSRQALLTGEVPKEELQFRKDKLTLHKEAFRLEVHDTILKSDKIQSEKELDRLKKASNNTKESLRQSRKVYKKYGLETRELERELESQGHNKLMALKAKNHSIYTNMVISSYNKSIELIRKRQEKFLLIQSLHEVGNLYYSDNQLRHAETQWND